MTLRARFPLSVPDLGKHPVKVQIRPLSGIDLYAQERAILVEVSDGDQVTLLYFDLWLRLTQEQLGGEPIEHRIRLFSTEVPPTAPNADFVLCRVASSGQLSGAIEQRVVEHLVWEYLFRRRGGLAALYLHHREDAEFYAIRAWTDRRCDGCRSWRVEREEITFQIEGDDETRSRIARLGRVCRECSHRETITWSDLRRENLFPVEGEPHEQAQGSDVHLGERRELHEAPGAVR